MNQLDVQFDFREDPLTEVYTTQQLFDGDPILFVYHHTDGDWQFHTCPEPDIEDGMLIPLEEIVLLDPSVNELHRLLRGWMAWRQSPNDPWNYELWTMKASA